VKNTGLFRFLYCLHKHIVIDEWHKGYGYAFKGGAVMHERFITRRTLRHLLRLSPQQFTRLELDPHLEQFIAHAKGGAICYRLKDIEQHLKVRLYSSEF
jgi:hypothetical protein